MSDQVPRRPRPPLVAGEREMLVAWLDWQRATLERKCHGLDPAELAAASVPPSTLTLLGLVRHMADVERWWFQECFAGRRLRPLPWSETDPGDGFSVPPGAEVGPEDVAGALEAWREACRESRGIAEGAGLDDLAAHQKPRPNLRWVLIHMIEEYARHNGHADLLRERIDGATGY